MLVIALPYFIYFESSGNLFKHTATQLPTDKIATKYNYDSIIVTMNFCFSIDITWKYLEWYLEWIINIIQAAT